jgi:SAM-dependent methyltransferase
VSGPRCRLCRSPLEHVFADLGMSPLANSFVPADRAAAMEPFYPLRALVCADCLLVQLEEYETPAGIFTEYAYFSSYSSTWVEHSRRYVEAISERFGIGEGNRVVELASNDGYLLQFFHERGVPVIGVEPAANVAKVAIQKGIPTLVEFFGEETARSLADDTPADLIVANNVLAHVPDTHDFVAGIETLLAPGGIATLEFPHLMQLMSHCEFDTIYHEHFSYFSLATVQRLFGDHGLRVFDVEELPTHGGSLRLYVCRDSDETHPDGERVASLRERELDAGMDALETYTAFDDAVQARKRRIVSGLIALRDAGLRIAGYGAPAKANTLLNYCGIGTDLIDFTVDRNPHKQGSLLPGSRIPVKAPEALTESRPDVIVVLPWNLRDEILDQLSYARDWGARFAIPGEGLEVLP